MKINGWTIQVVCANVEDSKSVYDNIYDNIEECYREHPESNIVIGFYLKPEDDRIASPDWFWNIESAVTYANSNYGGWNKKVIYYPISQSDLAKNDTTQKETEMKNNSWEELRVKYPEDRDDMSKEREREFVNDCFSCYEKEGFAKKYWSPFGDYKERIGQSFTVIGRCTEENTHLSALPMWNIKFKDGTVIGAYPEEIISREMKENGCQMEDID